MRPSRPSGRPRAHELARGLAGLLVVATLVIGLPVLLWTAVGWPLPHTIPSLGALHDALLHGSISDQVVVNGLALLTWLAWAQFVVCLTAEARAALKGRLAGRVPLATWGAQALAARLVAAVLLLAPVVNSPRPAVAATPVVVQAPVTRLFDSNSSAPNGTPAFERAGPARHVVQPKETLWAIAERYYGDGRLYRKIFESNEGRLQPDGRRLTNPNRIHTGWILVVPDHVGEGVSDGNDHLRTPQDQQEQRDGGTPKSTTPATPPPGGTEGSRMTHRPGPREQLDHATEHRRRPAICLPSGSLVGLSLAIALSNALALALLHRRRRYRPAPPRPGLRESDPLLTPDIRRICNAACQPEHEDDDERERSAGKPLRSVQPTWEPSDRPIGQPHLRTVKVGVRDGAEVAVDLAACGGLGLVGPGAHAAVRALIAGTLAAGRAQAAEVLFADNQLAAELLPGVAGFPGLTLAADLAAALARLEIELLYRSRLLDGDEAADIATFAAAHPAEPLPLLLLITKQAPPALQHRLAAVTSLGRHLGMSVVLLGAASGGATIAVAADGHIERIDPPGALPELAGAWLYTLREEEVAQVLAVIAAASDAEPAPEPAEAPAPSPHATAMVQLGTTAADTPPFAVRMLGPLRVDALGVELRTGLRSKARDLLAFLLIHPDGVTTDEIVDAIWPEADPERGTQRFRTTLGNLRSTLKLASGRPDIAVVEWTGSHYRIQADLFDCDLWRLEAALHDAATADDPTAQAAALEQAAATRQGDLLEGNGAMWTQAPREDFRHRGLNTLVQLAELRQRSGNPDGAIAALEQAVTIDPYTEDLYRKLIRLHADLARPEAIRRILRQLETRLEEIDAEPDQTTTELASELLSRATVSQDPKS